MSVRAEIALQQPGGAAMLAVRGLAAGYGGAQVLFGVDLDIGRGEVVTLIGRNGMGKTTTVRAVMGLIPATAAYGFYPSLCTFISNFLSGRSISAVVDGHCSTPRTI